MRIAVIGDLHANLPALLAVLEDARALGCDAIWCVGDVVGRGPHPGEVVDELRRQGVLTVQGNWDEAVGLHREQAGVPWARPEDELDGAASLAWTIAHTTEEQRTWLRQLPATHRVEAEGRSILLFHGSPHRQTDYLWADRPSRVFARIGADQGDDLFCFGNTHETLHRIMGSSHFVAAGSVGCASPDDPNADYAVVDMTSAELAVIFRSVPYDHRGVEASMRAAGLAPSLLWMPPALHVEPEAEAEQLVEA